MQISTERGWARVSATSTRESGPSAGDETMPDRDPIGQEGDPIWTRIYVAITPNLLFIVRNFSSNEY
jgi:hypothetical protein